MLIWGIKHKSKSSLNYEMNLSRQTLLQLYALLQIHQLHHVANESSDEEDEDDFHYEMEEDPPLSVSACVTLRYVIPLRNLNVNKEEVDITLSPVDNIDITFSPVDNIDNTFSPVDNIE